MQTEQSTSVNSGTVIKRPWRDIWDRLKEENPQIFQPKEHLFFAKTLGQMQAEISAHLQKKNV